MTILGILKSAMINKKTLAMMQYNFIERLQKSIVLFELRCVLIKIKIENEKIEKTRLKSAGINIFSAGIT